MSQKIMPIYVATAEDLYSVFYRQLWQMVADLWLKKVKQWCFKNSTYYVLQNSKISKYTKMQIQFWINLVTLKNES